jgi:signal transduction histidine kinase
LRWLVTPFLGFLALLSVLGLVLLGLGLQEDSQVAQENLTLADETFDLSLRPFNRAQRKVMEIRVLIQRPEIDPADLRNEQALMVQTLRVLIAPNYSSSYPPAVKAGMDELVQVWENIISPQLDALAARPSDEVLRAQVDTLLTQFELDLDLYSTQNGIHRLGRAGQLNDNAEAVLLGMRSSLQLAALAGGGFMLFSGLAFLNMRQISQQRERSRQELAQLNTELEGRVAARTQELAAALEQARLSQAQAEQANKVKSMFLANMSHELRTPLNAILNFSHFMTVGMLGPVNDRQQDGLQKIKSSGQHLLNLINDVLDISKIEAGALELFVEDDVNLREEAEIIEAAAEALLKDKPVTFEITFPPDMPLLRGDRQRLTQILLNLVSNACKFTDQGSVKLGAEVQGELILFRVQDTGPGIPAEEGEKVFQIFQQTNLGLRKAGGTGLGLPISRRLAEAHHGSLWFESQPGQGTSFYLKLPIRSEHLTPAKFH